MSEQSNSIIPLSLVPPGVRDERQMALAQLFGEALAEIDLGKLTMANPLTVDARLLPYMIREFGAQNLIDPGLPEHVQRRILANIWELKALHGYDAGVKLGLKLLGMVPEITHWHQMDPKGPANTHRITFYVGEQLFQNNEGLFGEREIRAAKRMINATKRWSQDSTYVVGARMRTAPQSMAARLRGLSVTRACMRLSQHPPRLSMRPIASASTRGVTATRLTYGGAHA